MKCPYCGKEFIWGSDNTLDEVGILPEGTEDSATASNYSCDNCGAGAMVWECPDEDKPKYKFWNKQ